MSQGSERDYSKLRITGVEGWGEGEKQTAPGFRIMWACEGVGFGEFMVGYDRQRRLVKHTECMSDAFQQALMRRLLALPEVS